MQEQPNYQPPQYTQYPPQQPYYPPPPPPKKKHTALWITLTIIGVLLFACIGVSVAATNSSKNAVNDLSTAVATTGSTSTDATSQATSAPAQTFKPITVSGNGPKKTAVFNAPATWSIAYTCYGFNEGVDGAFTVSVYGADGTIMDAGVINATCKANGKTSDSTIEHQGGSVYLDINATGQWSLTVKAA